MSQPTASSESISIFNSTHPPLPPASPSLGYPSSKKYPGKSPGVRSAPTRALVGAGVLRGHQVPLQGRHCPPAGHRGPAAAIGAAVLPLDAVGSSHSPRTERTSLKAMYEPCILFTCKERGTSPCLSGISAEILGRKMKIHVLHMRNICHSQLWFLPCQPWESFMIACIKHKCSLVCFEGSTQRTVYFPVTCSNGNDVPKYL